MALENGHNNTTWTLAKGMGKDAIRLDEKAENMDTLRSAPQGVSCIVTQCFCP